MWSLGILLYALLCGFLPYDDDDTQKLYRLIQRGIYEIPSWLTPGSQEIIACLLKVGIACRVHSWQS
jgi:maternal embryonic leucine zipper kinase